MDPVGLTCRLGVGQSVSRQVDPEGLTCRLGVGQSVSHQVDPEGLTLGRQVDPEGLTWCSEEWSPHLVATRYRGGPLPEEVAVAAGWAGRRVVYESWVCWWTGWVSCEGVLWLRGAGGSL